MQSSAPTIKIEAKEKLNLLTIRFHEYINLRFYEFIKSVVLHFLTEQSLPINKIYCKKKKMLYLAMKS